MLEKIQSTQDLKQKAALVKEWLKQGDRESGQILQYLDSELDSSQVKAWIKLCLKSKLFLLQKFKVKPENLDENRFVADLEMCTEPKEVTILLQAYSKAMNSSHQGISHWLQARTGDPALGNNCKKMLAYISKKPAPASAQSTPPATQTVASVAAQEQAEKNIAGSSEPSDAMMAVPSNEETHSEAHQAAATNQESGPPTSIDSSAEQDAINTQVPEQPATQEPAESVTSAASQVQEKPTEVPIALVQEQTPQIPDKDVGATAEDPVPAVPETESSQHESTASLPQVQDQASEETPVIEDGDAPEIPDDIPKIPDDIPKIPEEVPQIPDDEEQEAPVHPALIGISQDDEDDEEEEIVFEEQRSQGRFSGFFKLVSLVCIAGSIGGFGYLYQQPSFSQYVDEVFRENSPAQLEDLLQAPELIKLSKDPIPLAKMKKSPVDVVPQNEKVLEQMEQAQDIETKHGNKGSKDDPRLDPSVISQEFFGKKPAFLEAVLLFRRATILTDIDAMFDLAYMYDDGRGVGESMEKAYIWYAFAAQNGHPDAADELEFLRDKLSDEQITRLAKITSGPIELVPFP